MRPAFCPRLPQGLHHHLRFVIDIECIIPVVPVCGAGRYLPRRTAPLRAARTADQHSHLPQQVVLQFVGFIKRLPKRIGARHRGHRHNRRGQPQCQPQPQRMAYWPLGTIHPAPRTFLMASLPSFLRSA